MKKLWIVLAVIAIGAGLFFGFRSKNSAPGNPVTSTVTRPAAVSEESSTEPAAPKNSEGVSRPAVTGASATASAPHPGANTPGLSRLPPMTVLDNARVVIKNYESEFGENPVGTNAEITEALMGKNPKGITFVTEESGLRMNENGEMVDAWGIPFFFHQISGHEMEIRSAGADHKLWTADDLITR